MQPQIIKWTLLLLGVFLLCLAGWWVWFSSPADSTNQGQTTFGNAPLQSKYTVGTSGNGSQPASTMPGSAKSLNIADAFAALFSKTGAVGVSFDLVDASSGGDKAAMYALYAKDVAISRELYPREQSYPLRLALVDLNDDGTSEAIVYKDLPGFCSFVGCPFDIYQKQAGAWKKIFSSVVQGEVGLLNVYVNSYRSLLLTLSGRESGSYATSYTWDGKTYQSAVVVATWGETGFVLSQ